MAKAYIYPTSISYIDAGVGPNLASGDWSKVDEPFDAPDDADYLWIDGESSTFQGRALTVEFGAPPRFAAITSVTIVARMATHAAGPNDIKYGPRIGGVHYYDTAANDLTITEFSKVMLTDPSTASPGLPWTQGGIDALNCDFDDVRTALVRDKLFHLYAIIEGVLAPQQLSQSRVVLSQRLRLRRNPIPLIDLELPILRADTEILGDVSMAHRDLAWASSGQRGVNPWERVYLRVLRQAPDYLEMRTRVKCLDVRRYITSLWDTLRSDEDPSAQYQGVARLNAGGGRTFARASPAWVPSPVSQSRSLVRVIRLTDDTEKTLYDGTLVEEASTNQLKRSSAVSGATGYTDSGASGTWTTTTTTDPLFDSSITANLIVGTAGSPHTADLVRQWPDTASLAGGGYVAIQVDHKDDSGAALGWKLQRLVDNYYWNAGTSAWQAGTVTNLMAVRTEWQQTQDRLGVIAYGAGATALRFSLVIPSGGTAGRVNRIAHVQIGNERWYASRIVTDAAVVTTAADDIAYENNTGARSHVAAQGSGRATVIPSWNSADQATGQTFVVWEVYHDANNYEVLAYDTTLGAWVHKRRAAGTTTTASKTASVTAGTAVRLVARRCGSLGEWGLAPWTHSVFVDGVKGTDGLAAAAMTETSPSTVRIGRDVTGNRLRGRIYELDFSPFVWSDDECLDA